MADTDPLMPMGRTVLPLPSANIPLKGRLSMPGSPGPAAATPPAAAVPAAPAPAGAPPAPFPTPGTKPFWQVRQQPDGSSINYIPAPDGDPSKEVILSVNPAPKIPTALQPKPAAQQQ